MRYIITSRVQARSFTSTVILALTFSCLTWGASEAGEVPSEAQQIDIVSNGVVAPNATAPRFSSDGRYLFYLKLPNQGMIVNATTFRPISSHKLFPVTVATGTMFEATIKRVAWSPDNKKVAYCLSDKLYILDINASKSTEIPSSGRVCVSSAWVWYEPYKILFVENDYSVLNLETLQTEQIFRSYFDTDPYRPLRPTERAALKQKETEHNARRSALERQVRRQNHIGAYIHAYIAPGLGTLAGLVVSALDDTYHKLLLNGTFYASEGDFDVSPNLDSIVYRVGPKLLYAKLGAGKPRPTKFVIALDKRGQLSESEQQVFEKNWQGIRVRSDDRNVDGELTKPSFWGDVYAPQVNPLTGKVVGPDQTKPKGRIIFESSADRYSIVRSYFETSPIKVGDVVTNIRSDMVGGHGFSAGNIWLPLKSLQEVPAVSSQASP